MKATATARIWGLIGLVVAVGLLAPPTPTAQTTRVANNAASLAGKTILTAEDTQTVTGAVTFNRGANAPFGINSGAAAVANLDADKLDGQHGSFYQSSTNQTSGTLPLARLTDSVVTSAYTPTWGNLGTANTLGNGSITGTSLQIGKLVYFTIALQWGSTTAAGSANWTFSLPVAATTAFGGAAQAVLYFDSSASAYYAGIATTTTTTTIEPRSGAIPAAVLSATVPFTWATGDVVLIRGWYFAA